MSSSVCQGLQTCLELRHIESHLLRLKLAPPKTNFPASSIPPTDASITGKCNNNAIDDCKPIGNAGCWSFLQSLAAADCSSTKNEKVYVHPLVKRSTSTLSERSLEMCTESLGSETGSEVSDSIDDISLLSLENGVYNSKPRDSSARKKTSRVHSFPPPLTSISGSNGVKVVKSHREGGRLVLEAVTIPPCNTYFHTERSQGRLRLSLFKDADATATVDGEEEVVEKHDGDGEVVKGKGRDEKRVKIWKEIVGVSWLKPKTEVKKVGGGRKGFLIGSHCWWGDYLKAKTWKISLNPTGHNYYYYFSP
ncbi:hypothetical protein HRI_001051900 [Hibiscus trionum]|uniref:FAF domain-containing protein n=1 Tax=Hibiscus trionum TaxID=183268 RepID=A0A9W7HB92_HIBTR|nr:hypothetical protein HRI_001051900 [Hibiscus trionum]